MKKKYIVLFFILLTIHFILPRIMKADPFVFLSSDGTEVASYTEEEILKHNFKNSINLDKNRKKAFLVGLSTRIDTNMYSDGIYLVSIENEIIGLRRNKRWRNKKKVCSKQIC